MVQSRGDGDGYGTRAVGFGRSKTEEFEEDSNPLQRIPLTRSDLFIYLFMNMYGDFLRWTGLGYGIYMLGLFFV